MGQISHGFKFSLPCLYIFPCDMYYFLNRFFVGISLSSPLSSPSSAMSLSSSNILDISITLVYQKISYRWCSDDITFLCSQHIIQLLSPHISLQWRHNGRDSVSNHQPHDCLLKRVFRCRSKKHQSRGPVNSPHKWPVTRKLFQFDDVIMCHLSALYFQMNCNFRT